MNNVETLANVGLIVREGADWFRQRGTETSPGTMLFTVCGDVRRPGVYELPLGVSLQALVDEHAGGPPKGQTVKAIFPGASAGILPAAAIDTPLAFDAMKRAGSGLGSGGFVVYDDTACMVALAEVDRAARGDANLLPPMKEALRCMATVGEICDTLRTVFGRYRPADAM